MIFKRKGCKNYYVRLFKNGRERLVSLRTDKLKIATQKAARLRYGTLPDILRAVTDKPDIAIASMWEEYEQTDEYKRLKESTRESNIVCFHRFVEWALEHGLNVAGKIDAETCREYLASRDVKSKTWNNLRQLFSGIWKALELQPNPWHDLKTKQIEMEAFRPFTDAEVEAIRVYVSKYPDFWGPAVEIALFTGLRLKDIVMLQWSSIKENHLELMPEKTQRTGRKVYIPLLPPAKAALAAIHRAPGVYVFPDDVKRYESNRRVFSTVFSRMLKRCDIKEGKVGFHSLRDTFATKAKLSGLDTDSIRAIMGHTTKEMTRHYIDHPEAVSLASFAGYGKSDDRIKTVSQQS